MGKSIRFKVGNEKLYPYPYFPIGYIYLSTSNTNPSTYFDGTWEQIKDKFLLTAGDSYSAGSTGGSATHKHTTQGHTLTIAEMPSHTHTQNSHRHQYYNTWSIKSGTGGGNNVSGMVDDGYNGSNNYTNYTTATNQNTGGGGSHSHGDTGSTSTLPPYLVVYAWKRVA